MCAAAAFSRPPSPPKRSLADTLQQITLRSPKEAAALQVLAEMVLLRLIAQEQTDIWQHTHG